MLTCLVYVSSARHVLTGPELAALLETSRRNNARRDVTGMLLHVGGNFMQALEGEAEAVSALYDFIGTDPRHRNIKKLLQVPLENRLFSEWSMAFREVGDLPDSVRDQVSSFLDDALIREDETPPHTREEAVMNLLERFAQTMR